MSRVPINTLLSLSCRSYSMAAEAARVPSAAALPQAAAKIAAESGNGSAAKQEAVVFWMRDPKTGYWIPENQMDAVDPADLRAKLLSARY